MTDLAHLATVTRDEIQASATFTFAQQMVDEAERVWNKAVMRELDRRAKNRFRRDQYSAEELFARLVIDKIGCSSDVLAETVARVVEEVVEAEAMVMA